MKRVLVTGSGGAGKTTFSNALSELTGLPVIHLDYYFHQSAEKYTNYPDIWIKKVNELLHQDNWIMEGNYSSTYEKRFALADTFIFLDIPTRVTMWSVIKRLFKYRNKKRPEMPESWEEKFNFEFIKYVLFFNWKSRPKLVNEIERYRHEKLDVNVFKSRKEAYKWLKKLEVN
jgi:adenylate kinase family enzyme